GRREPLLTDLCQGRKVASDVPTGDFKSAAEQLRSLRRVLSPYEQACFRVLGQTVAHALEATCRNVTQGDTEREVAGQLSHRLYHRGAVPLFIGVAADGRSRDYRRPGFTATPVRQTAVLHVAAR